MKTAYCIRSFGLSAFLCLTAAASIAQEIAKPHALAPLSSGGILVALSADASRSMANDLFRATAFVEASDSNSATLARQVNQQISAAVAIAKSYPSVKVQTGSSHTYPVYGKNQRTIESWRMRSEIRLESREAAPLAELLGKLQGTLGVGQLSASPSPETAKKAEADATVAAIASFRERAALIAGTLGKKYRIREMDIGNSGSHPPVYPMRAKAMMAAEAAPMPIEAGESELSVTVGGKIELYE